MPPEYLLFSVICPLYGKELGAKGKNTNFDCSAIVRLLQDLNSNKQL
jgi:hypothetical protein